MSRIVLEIVPDPELLPPDSQVFPALGAAIGQLARLIRAGAISTDEVRAQLGLPGR